VTATLNELVAECEQQIRDLEDRRMQWQQAAASASAEGRARVLALLDLRDDTVRRSANTLLRRLEIDVLLEADPHASNGVRYTIMQRGQHTEQRSAPAPSRAMSATPGRARRSDKSLWP
jgi:hypothetical protein